MLVQKSKPNCSQGRVYSFVTAFHVPGTSVSFLSFLFLARASTRHVIPRSEVKGPLEMKVCEGRERRERERIGWNLTMEICGESSAGGQG